MNLRIAEEQFRDGLLLLVQPAGAAHRITAPAMHRDAAFGKKSQPAECIAADRTADRIARDRDEGFFCPDWQSLAIKTDHPPAACNVLQ